MGTGCPSGARCARSPGGPLRWMATAPQGVQNPAYRPAHHRSSRHGPRPPSPRRPPTRSDSPGQAMVSPAKATISGMTRVRISTTVDGTRLAAARSKLGVPDSVIVDRALAALLDELEAERERQALDAMPYEEDPDLSWGAPRAPGLAYDGTVPPDVQRLAAARRRLP